MKLYDSISSISQQFFDIPMVFWFSLCLLMAYPVLHGNKGNKLGTQSEIILGKDSANERWRLTEMSSSLAEPLLRTIPAQFFGTYCACTPSCPHEICYSILQHGKLFTTLFLSNMAIWCHIHYLSCAPHHIEGILPKGPYLPCVSMAGRALLAGYHEYTMATFKVVLVAIHSTISNWCNITGTPKGKEEYGYSEK